MERVPFIFCRYSAQIDDDELGHVGLFQALTDIQGRYLPHGRTAEREGQADVVVMRPRGIDVDGEHVVTWAMGHRPGQRVKTSYDSANQEIKQKVEKDDHIIFSDLIAIPRLGAMAVTDRQSALHMGGKVALSRTRSAFRFMDGGHFAFTFLAPGDVTAMMSALSLKEYSYTVRRINPTPPGVLSAALDSSMESEGIGILRGVAKPMPSGKMEMDEGLIAQTAELAGGGYGVVGFKGETEAGSVAQIRKPAFSLEKSENLKQMEKEQPLRVFVEEESQILPGVVAELVRFYDNDAATGVSEEPT
ncbi:MAG: hypothetical protein V2I27_15565 [Erythrobacter sp.]|jgi:hypothetical protein|nr:hypothetical protein [Erythrobacter sp.]